MSAICIRAIDLHHHYNGEIPALNGVDLEITSGTYLAVVGQNGSGKTTLVKHFNGLLKPTTGRVLLHDRDTRTVPLADLARTVGYAFQNPDHQIFCANTRDEIAFGPGNLGVAGEQLAQRVDETLTAFGLTPYADVPPAVLGYGLRRKVAVAAIYAMRPDVLVLDEPTSGLDYRSACDLMALVDGLHAQGHTIILVTHDMRLVAEHAHEVLVMHDGRVMDRGTPAEVFWHEDVMRTAQIEPPQIVALARRLSRFGLPRDLLNVPTMARAWRELVEGGE